jgi:hypothetical protein
MEILLELGYLTSDVLPGKHLYLKCALADLLNIFFCSVLLGKRHTVCQSYVRECLVILNKKTDSEHFCNRKIEQLFNKILKK